MAHHIYETECFVISLGNGGEANCIYTLFTEELGLIVGKAQGVRLLKSKLRLTLQAGTKCRVSLVRGKEFWRIVGAERPKHFWLSLEDKTKLALFYRVTSLIKKLFIGEGHHEEAYKNLVILSEFLSRPEKINDDLLFALELVTVSRILHSLGYFAPQDIYQPLLNDDLSSDLLLSIANIRKGVLLDINSALKETHLY